jgi:tetratricopeptide (TPR) repeat protein
MRSIANTLEGTSVPFKIEVFDGSHQWPPASLCTEAIEWMEIRAMKDGKKEKDTALIDALYAKSVDKAKNLESGGDLLDARDEYRSIQRDFEGLHDTTAVTQKLNELKDSPVLAKQVEQQKLREQKAQEFMMKLGSVTRSIRDTSKPVPKAETVSAFLGLEDLKKQATSGATPEDRTAAQSLLRQVYVNNIFYLPRNFIQVGDYARALLCFNIAGIAKENDPDVWYSIASVYAQMGDKKNAIDALKKAITFGFTDFQYIQQDADFDSLHEDKDYQKLIDSIKKNEQKSKS